MTYDAPDWHKPNPPRRPNLPKGGARAGHAPRHVLALARLASHKDIAWYLDGTLVDHPAAPVLHRFIRETPHIRHIVVSFRNARQGVPWGLLSGYGAGLEMQHFDRVVHMPDDLCAGISADAASRRGGRWRSLAALTPPWRRSTDAAHRLWKGQICQQEGFTALVDDLTSLVAEGCRRHGVELFHPSDFTPGP